jgi:hypothetical protein
MDTRPTTTPGRWAAVSILVAALVACGGSGSSDDAADAVPEPTAGATDATGTAGTESEPDEVVDSTADATDATGATDATDATDVSETGSSSSTSYVEIGGETYEFTNVIDCTFGDAFWGPDFRRISLDTGGDFPAIALGYAPPKADDEGVEDPNVVAVYPSADPWWYTTDASDADYEVILTDDGVAGSATMGVQGSGGPEGEVLATFELSCGDAAGGGDGTAGSTDESTDASGSAEAPSVATGTVVLAGQTFELTGPSRSEAMLESDGDADASSGDFDFEICETVNPAFAGEFNVVGTLGDGTPFRLSGNVDEEPGDLDGLFLGDTLDEERADELEVSLDGRTLSGSATTSRGDIEFTFTC